MTETLTAPNPAETAQAPEPIILHEQGRKASAFTWEQVGQQLDMAEAGTADKQNAAMLERMGDMVRWRRPTTEEDKKLHDGPYNVLSYKDQEGKDAEIEVPDKSLAHRLVEYSVMRKPEDKLDIVKDAVKDVLADDEPEGTKETAEPEAVAEPEAAEEPKKPEAVAEPAPRVKREFSPIHEYRLTTLGAPENPDRELEVLKLGAPVVAKVVEPVEEAPRMRWGYDFGKNNRLSDMDKRALWGPNYKAKMSKPKAKKEIVNPESPKDPRTLTPLKPGEIIDTVPEEVKASIDTTETVTEAHKPFRIASMPEEELDTLWGRKKAPKEAETAKPDRDAKSEASKRELWGSSFKETPSKEARLAHEVEITPEEVMQFVNENIQNFDREGLEKLRTALSLNYPEAAAHVGAILSEQEFAELEANTKERAKRIQRMSKKLSKLVLKFKPEPVTERTQTLPADEQQFDAA